MVCDILTDLRDERVLCRLEKPSVNLRSLVPKKLKGALGTMDGSLTKYCDCMDMVECLWLNAEERHLAISGDGVAALQIVDQLNERANLLTAFLEGVD